MSGATMRYFKLVGKVQRVMCRQTIVRAAQKRGLRAGATNDPKDKNTVYITLQGSQDKIEDLLQALRSRKRMNSWNARADDVVELTKSSRTGLLLDVTEHQVHTENVDSFNWNPNVKMYL